MNDEVKIVANYLPQFHEIPENNQFWGKGYTDWVAVRNAKPLFDGHNQPKVPYAQNYYSLDTYDSIEKQVKLANQYGIYGFNIYHYWFNNDLNLLTKPAQIIRNSSELQIHYMFTWDNASWKRTWSAVKHANDWAPVNDNNENQENKSQNSTGILAELIYGTENDWKNHFEYLLKYFKDERYIKEENMPLFGIFNPDNQPKVLKKMMTFWNKLAQENGFDGVKFICKNNHGENKISSFSFAYEPGNSAWESRTLVNKVWKYFDRKKTGTKPKVYQYENVWRNLIHRAKKSHDKNLCFGCFVNFDDSPRRGCNGRIISGGTPKLFENYLAQLIQICKLKKKTILFITAWNEWGEGAYLEPDESNGVEYLVALKNAIISVNELEDNSLDADE
ncbi:glycosyltransferase WbsX family protein [Hespellia stercorisuis]|uniref:Glycosyltransferase WbsX n=1 Tax=Hespellia stercorisuis DSM 15480 TaxID=1121950 RepID=A0A1M6TE24_9FIRM|nr:glycoside hydrolase family 99-like domain-containing protein [Hespellia stercorisuis]SHK55201.1 hypothetical protein SAMN02745243_03204 [Hespellia stercorisuis DSM 15480]